MATFARRSAIEASAVEHKGYIPSCIDIRGSGRSPARSLRIDGRDRNPARESIERFLNGGAQC